MRGEGEGPNLYKPFEVCLCPKRMPCFEHGGSVKLCRVAGKLRSIGFGVQAGVVSTYRCISGGIVEII